ncbi:MAG: type II CRISPR RNA-guided endonuclease Cas9 [Candidatus Sumerlaea chitinivorans]|nr:type II CRISPR RNA-guided endonuclease Cas9 [Candidatus Sumerlaea chitinivorans]
MDTNNLFSSLSTDSQDTPGWALGLDVGSNSIGWMLVREQPIDGEVNVIGGVRVFPAGTATEKATEKSKTEERRVARGMRRQHDRRSRRKRRLTYVLREIGLLPPQPVPIEPILQAIDPWEVRARGLDEPLKPEEFARALIHLNQRRGYRSNRRADAKKSESASIREKAVKLREEIHEHGCRTLGEYLYKHVPSIRERRRGRFFLREMVEEEFKQLWNRQAQEDPQHFTDAAKEKVKEAIFYQRPFLKRERLEARVGRCEFEPSEKRCRVAHRLAQRFRILQEVNNLRVIIGYTERALTPEERKVLIEKLESSKEVTLKRIPKLLGLPEDCEINLARGNRTKLLGNSAEAEFRKLLGDRWQTMTEEEKDRLCEAVLEEEDDALERRAREEFGFTEEQVKGLLEISLCDRFGRVSLKAIRRLLPFLEQGLSLTEAAKEAGYGDRHKVDRIYELLPFPPGTRLTTNPEREQELVRQGLLLPNENEITNPVVRKALFEVRKVVNAIIRKYGKPSRIVVELARETRGTIEERNEYNRKIREREKEKKQIKDELRKLGLHQPTGEDIRKYRLWKECNEICPYSGRPITVEQLFSGEVEVEHIWPYDRCLDNSFANLTLCFRDWNQRKGNRTPYEAFHQEPFWQEILERVSRFEGEYRWQKLRRFRYEGDLQLDDFVRRQLQDTQYIARVVRRYLELLGVPVNCTRGQVTAALRHLWGLDSILARDGSSAKNRDDHRHHAIDAAVIAMTTAKHLHNLSRREHFRRNRMNFPEPWPGFRVAVKHAVDSIVVSHAPTRRVRGPLHEETNYGLASQEKQRYVYRKPLEELFTTEVEAIRDAKIRRMVEERLDQVCPNWRQKGRDSLKKLKALENPILLPNSNGEPIPVRRVRLTTTIGNAIGLPRQAPVRYVKPGENHHIEIFERTDEKGQVCREVVAVTLFEAAQRLRNHQPVVSRVHPHYPDAKFLMSLCKNDMVRITWLADWKQKVEGKECCRKKGDTGIFVVATISCEGGRPDIRFEHHCDMTEHVRFRSLPNTVSIEKLSANVLGEVEVAHD